MDLQVEDQTHPRTSTPLAVDTTAPEQPALGKRDAEDDVQFLSSQPVKKLRTALPSDRTIVGIPQAVANDDSKLDRSVNTAPLGLPQPLLGDAPWDTKGTSPPTWAKFAFPPPCTPTTARPGTSAAVSPKQLPRSMSPSAIRGMSSQQSAPSLSGGMTIDEISCLDVRGPVDTTNMVNMTNNTANTLRDLGASNKLSNSTLYTAADDSINIGGYGNPSSSKNSTTDTNTHLPSVASMANQNAASFSPYNRFTPGVSSTFHNTPQSGYMPLNSPAPMPFAMYSMGNLVPMPQIPPQMGSSLMNLANNLGLPNSHGFNQQQQGGLGDQAAPRHTNNSLPSSGITTPSSNAGYSGISPQSVAPQRHPCQICAAARQGGNHAGGQGQSHGERPRIGPTSHPVHSSPAGQHPQYRSPEAISLTPPTNFMQQKVQFPTGAAKAILPPHHTHAQSPNPDTRVSAGQSAISSPFPRPQTSCQPRLTPSFQPQTPKPLPSQQQPQNPPSTLPAVKAVALSQTSSRTKHAANLLVDVAEIVGLIFPFEIVARQHGCQAHKVAEALAAVVQVPLLRCATDKRQMGKLGSERMREYRDARKEWIAMVKERRRKGDIWDEKGGHGGERDQKGNGVGSSVLPANGHGEPSPLDVALLLPPSDVPGVLMNTNFTGPSDVPGVLMNTNFTGPW